jgi:chorismate mutase/prephenate dehydratase
MQQDIMVKPVELDDLREKIDGIDAEIVALLTKRVEYVHEVGERKKAASTPQSSFVRPGRESGMVRALLEQIGDAYPKAAIAQMWRMIISSSLQSEKPFKVVALSSQRHNASFWLAREYLGSFTPLTGYPMSSQVIREVASHNAEIGVLPLPRDEHDEFQDEWWIQLASGENLPRVFACIPFVCDALGTQAVAIGYAPLEKTGQDSSLLMVDVDESVSKDRIVRTFTEKQIPVTIRGLKKNIHKPGARHILLTAGAFITENDPVIEAIVHEIGVQAIRIKSLGCFATPISA